MASMLKALLFDLYGTLSETDSIHYPTWARFLRPHGYDVNWAFYQGRISGRLNPDIVAELLPNLSPEGARAMMEAKEADFRERVGALSPCRGAWTSSSGAGKGMKVALVTNAPKENVLAVLRALSLDDAFDRPRNPGRRSGRRQARPRPVSRGPGSPRRLGG